jgi:small subunit ribosomal protein S17
MADESIPPADAEEVAEAAAGPAETEAPVETEPRADSGTPADATVSGVAAESEASGTDTTEETAPTPDAGPVVVAEPGSGAGASRSNRRKIREGLVLSVAMDRTAVVGVIDRVRHPRYAKTVQRTKRLYAHDEDNDLRVGDRVRLAEIRPMSKLKRWRVVDVLERAK